MNIRSLLSLILLFATTFDATLFAAKRSFDEADESEHSSDDDFCDDDQEDDKDAKSKKSYPCKTCGKPFANSSNRIRHNRIHSGKEPYPCRMGCSRSFADRSNRNKHERIHTEERSFPCNECEKSFARKDRLTRHERIHSEERPYSCKHCNKKFSDRSNRNQHELVVHSEMKYPCEYYKKKYTQQSNCKRHQKNCNQNPSLSQAGPALPEPTLIHENDDVVAPASEPSLLSDTAITSATDSLFLIPQEFPLDQEALDSIDFPFPSLSTDEI